MLCALDILLPMLTTATNPNGTAPTPAAPRSAGKLLITMKTISFTVHHGNTNKTVTGMGETIRAALADILKTPLGIGYAIDEKRERFAALCESLETTGSAQWGWGDYSVTTPAATATAHTPTLAKHPYAFTMHCVASPDGYGWDAWLIDETDGSCVGDGWGVEPHEARIYALRDAEHTTGKLREE